MLFKRCLVVAKVLVCLTVLPMKAVAWGADGHRLIAEVAESRLSEPARKEVQRLLALEPGATLASVSTWADEFRSPQTAPWHYVNFPSDGVCRYTAEQNCIEGACVVSAIERQVFVLSSSGTDEERLKALKYVVHFIADVHQPLHAGLAADRGGNNWQLQAFGHGSNLHAVWDSGIIRQWPGGIDALRSAVARVTPRDGGISQPAQWAEESCRVVATNGFYPSGRDLDDAYVERWSGVVVTRMALAVSRLVTALNASFAGPRP